jgi:hypothetical protein
VFILHWAVPGALDLKAAIGLTGAGPSLSSEFQPKRPSVVPRELPRTLTLEARTGTFERSGYCTGGKPHAVISRPVIDGIPGYGTAAPNIVVAVTPVLSVRVFDPRAPPVLMA